MIIQAYFFIGGLNIEFKTDFPIDMNRFDQNLIKFQIKKPTTEVISFKHYLSFDKLDFKKFGKRVLSKSPWIIYSTDKSWIYILTSPNHKKDNPIRLGVFNLDYSGGKIYHNNQIAFKKGNLRCLTLFPNDQIIFSHIFANRNGIILHASGVIFSNNGFAFVGHSESGKSTIVSRISKKKEILSDENIIIRKVNKEYKIYGTWQISTISEISRNFSPLKAIIFLEKAIDNQLKLLHDYKEKLKRITPCLIRPYVNKDWWEKSLNIIDDIIKNIPCYILESNLDLDVDSILSDLL